MSKERGSTLFIPENLNTSIKEKLNDSCSSFEEDSTVNLEYDQQQLEYTAKQQ